MKRLEVEGLNFTRISSTKYNIIAVIFSVLGDITSYGNNKSWKINCLHKIDNKKHPFIASLNTWERFTGKQNRTKQKKASIVKDQKGRINIKPKIKNFPPRTKIRD